MDEIKIRTKGMKTIKALNKSVTLADKTKDTIVSIKNRPNVLTNNESEKEYGNNKIEETSKKALVKSEKVTKRTLKKTPKRIKDGTVKVKKVTKKTVKSSKKIIDSSIKAAKKTYQITKQLAKITVKAIKLTIKAIVSAIKGIIAGTKALVSAIAAGGWIAVLIIIIICIVALICASAFGIFASNETSSKTISNVISDINNDLYTRIETIKSKNKYDELELETIQINWKEVLAIYSIKYNNNGKQIISTIDDASESQIKDVFWDMYYLDSNTKLKKTNEFELKQVLTIKLYSISKEQIINKYLFNEFQKKQLNELLDNKLNTMWDALIYNSKKGNMKIVEIAKQQVGNVGGEPYWRWYGFNKRIEWCAVFVSWVANEAGFLNDKIPKFSGVKNGIEWFKSKGEWKNKGYIPSPGDIIFFDWEVDGLANHVGIVEKVDNGYIYTIEGNSTEDGCREKKYLINQKEIYGFGIPNY